MKRKDMFLDNGYLNMKEIMNIPVPFIFIVGARGIGKTYGAIKELVEQHQFFMLLRRTQMQADFISNPMFSPITAPLDDMGIDFDAQKLVKGSKLFINTSNGEEICYSAALSTIGNLRGMANSRTKCILYDEFIPSPGERTLAEEGELLFHAYETVNRNRELNGQKPVKLVCLANGFNIANEVFITQSLVTVAYKMIMGGEEVHIDTKRGYALLIPMRSKISQKKSDTALYRFAKDTQFSELALMNEFRGVDEENVQSKPLVEHKILCTLGELSIYRHKSNGTYYVCSVTSGTPKNSYSTSATDIERFKRRYGDLWFDFLGHNIFFSNFINKVLFLKYFNRHT